MKKTMCLLFLSCVLLPAIVSGDDAGTKLGRGLSNTAFGMFEMVNELGTQSDKHGPWIGVPAGIIRGAVFGLGRELAGVCEIITFPFPNGKRGYEPLVLPESVFQRR